MDTTENLPGSENELSDEFFQNIFLHAGDGIYLATSNGLILEVNPRGCELLGFTRQELIGKSAWSLTPLDETDHVLEKLAELASGKQMTVESVLNRKDNTRLPVEISAKILSNGQLVSIIRDITDRKHTEEALIESEQKFRSLVEHSPDGITIVDENGYIVEWNQGQEDLTGLKRSSVIGKPVWEIQFQVTPDGLRSDQLLERLKQKTLDILASGHGPGLNQPKEKIMQLPDGTHRNLEIMTYSYQTKLGYRVGSIARDITKRKQIDLLLEHMATHDVLTDLPNRQLLQDRLELALQRIHREPDTLLAVMMLDLDNFKEVNDSHGHACGDQLLKIISQRLQECIRRSDTVARMGGDEFALILERIADMESIHGIAQKILSGLAQEIRIEEGTFKVTASIGISLYSSNSNDASSLLRKADVAMYHAKRTRNCYRFFSSS